MKATRKNLTWPIFIISLPDCTDRREPLIKDLNKAGLDFQIFPAVDAREGVPNEYEHMIDRDGAILALRREMSEGEFGCALSHQLIYKKVIDNGLPGAIIFEDDARLMPQAGRALTSNFFSRYDFTQFNYGFARIPRFALTRKTETDEVSTIRLLCNSGLASGYAVSRRGCKYISQTSLRLTLPADWPCDLRPIKPRITLPKLVTAPQQNIAQSTVAASRKEKKEAMDKLAISKQKISTAQARNPRSKILKHFAWLYSNSL